MMGHHNMVETLSMPLLYFLAVIALGPTLQVQSSSSRSADCREWRQCQQLALEARERGDYERFHDLAWRTVQTGPARDPMLMYLLARAQSCLVASAAPSARAWSLAHMME